MDGGKQFQVYHWKYDDGTRGYAVRQIHGSEEWLKYDYCTKDTEFERIIRELKSKNKVKVTKTKRWIPGGLANMQPSSFPKRNAYDSQEGVGRVNNKPCKCQ